MVGQTHLRVATLALLFFEILTRIRAEYNNLADVPCGTNENRIGYVRIVGGQKATLHEFPWLVSITRKGGHTCGGTIISDRFVLTAGHCLCSYIRKIPVGELRVTLGEHNLKGPEEPAARNESVINAVLHPGYKCGGKYVDDIALLELGGPITWSESVKPACLPVATGQRGYSTFDGERAIVAGWGWLGEDRSKYKRADVLQKVEVPVVPNAECIDWYRSEGKSTRVSSTQMCAGYKEGGRDSCWADSGGPLMVGSRPGGRAMVVGVVSSGIGCGRPRLPGIYTRTSHYVDWITEEVQSRARTRDLTARNRIPDVTFQLSRRYALIDPNREFGPV